MARIIHSFVWGGINAAIFLTIGIITENILIFIGIAVLSFALISCLILNNNFIGDMMLEIFSWGFVKFPGLIFTLDLDGIIWLLTVKLVFWIIGFLLATLVGLLAVALGLVLSVFVYPFALTKAFTTKDIQTEEQ